MHKENSREFKGKFKAGRYGITDSETFQWMELKVFKNKTCVTRRDRYREDISFVSIVFKQIDFEKFCCRWNNSFFNLPSISK